MTVMSPSVAICQMSLSTKPLKLEHSLSSYRIFASLDAHKFRRLHPVRCSCLPLSYSPHGLLQKKLDHLRSASTNLLSMATLMQRTNISSRRMLQFLLGLTPSNEGIIYPTVEVQGRGHLHDHTYLQLLRRHFHSFNT